MMKTFSQINTHIVFAVRHRERSIPPAHKEELHRLITGIVTNKGQKLLAINSMPDHIHLLTGLTAVVAPSDIVRDIKANSSRLINERGWTRDRFQWQEGFGAFSYSRSQIPMIARYIANQERHHATRSFSAEVETILNAYDIDYDERDLPHIL